MTFPASQCSRTISFHDVIPLTPVISDRCSGVKISYKGPKVLPPLLPPSDLHLMSSVTLTVRLDFYCAFSVSTDCSIIEVHLEYLDR